MSPVSFDSGISSISRLNNTQVSSDFPKSKTALKPSGEKVEAYFWKALDMGRNFQSREMRFATRVPEQNTSMTPEEHHMMTNMALTLLNSRIRKEPENSETAVVLKQALSVFQEARENQEYLMMCRNVLIAG